MTPTQHQRVLVLSYSPIAQDSRVLRQLRWLSEEFRVDSAGFGPQPSADVRHVQLRDLPPYEPGQWNRIVYIIKFVLRRFHHLQSIDPRDQAAFEQLQHMSWDLIVANDVDSLPLAFRLRSRSGVVADLHEFASRQDEHSFTWRTFIAPRARWLVKTFVPRAVQVTTVSHGLADGYLSEFGVAAAVVANAAQYQELEPQPVRQTLRLVHSGIAAPQRKLETLVEAMRQSNVDATLDFYLLDRSTPTAQRLIATAAEDPRIRFMDPVEPEELPAVLNGYDVGIAVFPPVTFNLKWCLPNKFFDFVQARLGVISGPSPEMAREITEHGIGVVTADFSAESLAAELDSLTQGRVARWKAAAARAANPLSGEVQGEKFLEIVRKSLRR